MPKLKTKSGAKKRFKVTATGKVMHAQRGKRHGMIKRTKKQMRQLRGAQRRIDEAAQPAFGELHLAGHGRTDSRRVSVYRWRTRATNARLGGTRHWYRCAVHQ